MPDLLVELLAEEIPARMQADAATALGRALVNGLAERDMAVAPDAIHTHAGPRRIAAELRGVAASEPRRQVRRRGPRVDAPESAQAGFRRSLDDVAHTLEQVDEKKGRFWVAVVDEGGAPAADVIKSLLEGLLPRFPWPKSMRWGEGEARWVRPLRRIVCLLDDTVVPVRFAGLVADDLSEGHRFMAPGAVHLAAPASYAARLAEARVRVDREERRRLIADGAARLAAGAGLAVKDDPGLIDELVGLCEWPVPLIGIIDEGFMTLPEEVLTTSMRRHQKYLALQKPDGRLASRFVVVANIEAADGGAAIVAGNERVLRARLWDARYFWETDRKRPLDGGAEALERMVFHTQLGSMAEKVRRLERLSGILSRRLEDVPMDLAERAGRLAKADLVTGMVGEFPELQGVMGGHYARAAGELEAIAAAISEHYAPQGPSDRCPRATLSVVVALADKLDSLTGLFAAGERATGSGDALGLRRLALGVIRLVLENDLRLPLRTLIKEAHAGYPASLGLPPASDVASELMAFVEDRLRVHLRGEGLEPDLIGAVFARGDDDDVWRLRAKALAIRAFLSTPEGTDLVAAYRRARNIVRIETRKLEVDLDAPIDAQLMDAPAERHLDAQLAAIAPALQLALENEQFEDAMAGLATLRQPVDRFFEEVLVNVEDDRVRANRLRLLARLSRFLDDIAAFEVIDEPRPAA